MKNVWKILASVAAFVLCGLLGVFVGRSILDSNSSRQSTPVYSGVGSVSGGGSAGSTAGLGGLPKSESKPSKNKPAELKPEEPISSSPIGASGTTISSSLPEILDISKPEYDGNYYSFRVNASGTGLTYHLTDDTGRDITPVSHNGSTFKVRPTSKGKYQVYVTDINGNKSKYVEVSGCVVMIDKITASELQEVFDSEDTAVATQHDFKNRVASGCKYEFVGLNPESEGMDQESYVAPQSYNEIINRLHMNTWTSVKVVSVAYSTQGKLTKVVLNVNY